MSSTKAASKTEPTTKKFGKGTRTVPHPSQKAKKYYPAEDEQRPRKVRKSIRKWSPRESLQPGAILVLLAGRFRGKRVILLKNLEQGVLLVTGPFKVNGVPLRRVNHRYVIATQHRVNVGKVDKGVLDKVSEDGYFTRDKPAKKTGEDQFFSQGEKSEKKKVTSARASDQKSVDKVVLAEIAKEKMLKQYLASSFSLRKGEQVHNMKF